MQYRIFTTFCLILVPLMGKCLENPGKIFEQANQAYQEKNYKKAVKLYDSLYQAEYSASNLFFNMGNAYYKLDRIPESILFYEKAQKISGYRKDIAYNLALARKQIPDDVKTEKSTLIQKWWNKTIQYFSVSTWGLLTVVFVWVGILGVGGSLLLKIFWLRRLTLFTAILALILFAGSMVLTLERYEYTTENHHGVIFSPSVYVKSAPDPKSKDLFILHGGTKVALENELNNWKKIKLPDGKEGWVRKNVLRVI